MKRQLRLRAFAPWHWPLNAKDAWKYPYLAVAVVGFCIMISPLLFLLILFPAAWLGSEIQIPLNIAVMFTEILRLCLSARARWIHTVLFVLGFCVMNVGWILHCRHRKTIELPTNSD